jgi:small subunit ribosomal protein S11
VDLVSPPSNSLTAPSLLALRGPPPEPHHFHVFSSKHNTHIALTRPNREPIIGLSAGNIGFRKAQRGSYDAAFQLAAYVMKMIQDRGLLRSDAREESAGRRGEHPIQRLEIVLRGFGRGREAVMKAMLGTEGRWLRTKVVKVSDSTRLKFGGTRSQNPRRL